VKAMNNPPAGVKIVMSAVCIMKDIKPERINDPAGTGQKVSYIMCELQERLFTLISMCRHKTTGDQLRNYLEM